MYLVYHRPKCSGDRDLHLTHLSSLREVIVLSDYERGLPTSFILPAQVKKLKLFTHLTWAVTLLDILRSRLQQLQQLKLHLGVEEDSEQLQLLTSLGQLQELRLRYDAPFMAVRAAPVWQRLPLVSLEFPWTYATIFERTEPDIEAAVMQGSRAARSLTQLQYSVMEGSAMSIFPHLQGLSNIQALRLELGASTEQEALLEGMVHLTGLTALTHLSLQSFPTSDLVAVALACYLTGLKHLELTYCELFSTAALPAIGRLSGLTHLNLTGNNEGLYEGEGLLQLAGLRSLRKLAAISFDNTWDGFSAEVAQQLWGGRVEVLHGGGAQLLVE